MVEIRKQGGVEVLYRVDAETLEGAVPSNTKLRCADLFEKNLTGVNLEGADLTAANLIGAERARN